MTGRNWQRLKEVPNHLRRKKLFRPYDAEDFDRLRQVLSATAHNLLEESVIKNRGTIVINNIYNDPGMKNANYKVLSSDHSFIGNRDPKLMAEIGEALAALELEGLLWSNDPQRAIFKATERGVRLITGAGFPTPKQKRNIWLVCLWVVCIIVVAVTFFIIVSH
jgi:hypothetical protein